MSNESSYAIPLDYATPALREASANMGAVYATSLRVKDAADEIDLEPVAHSALRSLLDTQRTVPNVPLGIDPHAGR